MSKNSMKINLRKFDPSKIVDGSIILLLGKRATGKSFCMKDLLSYKKDIPIGCVISPTEIANEHFGKFIPNMLIHDEYTPELLKKFLDRQKNIMEKVNREKRATGVSHIDPRAFLILDDCMYDKTYLSDKSFRFLMFNGRHVACTFFISSQYSMGLPPQYRANIDYIFLFNENQQKNQKRCHETYGGAIDDFRIFKQVMDQCTKDYGCMVIDNKTQSGKLEDQIFWYKASESDFKMCNIDIWNMQYMEEERREKYGEPDEDDTIDDFDPNVLMKQTTKIKVNFSN
jgi:hypothetical protein